MLLHVSHITAANTGHAHLLTRPSVGRQSSGVGAVEEAVKETHKSSCSPGYFFPSVWVSSCGTEEIPGREPGPMCDLTPSPELPGSSRWSAPRPHPLVVCFLPTTDVPFSCAQGPDREPERPSTWIPSCVKGWPASVCLTARGPLPPEDPSL